MSAETWNIILILLVVVVTGYAVYQQYKRGETFTVQGIASTLEESVPLARELLDVSQMVVNERELIKKNGKITNTEAFNQALDIIKGWSPAFAELENDKIITAINSAVLVASALSHQIKADKAVSSGTVDG